ncbi:cytochrome c3 family protein [Rhizosaccharibacter radicis]|uniref:Cytochrome c family protein n=1 Tax=Rhizosaccharibacter radicis TaxID=2782605 RepID=A0ABT1VUY5_9PROT|nr:cytochrome c family protein [Acetobacteraceae bacterium KSS12]
MRPSRQLFGPGADAYLRLALLCGAGGLLLLLVTIGAVSRSAWFYGVGVAPEQPVPFSHKHHAGELGIDCRYCHISVEHAASPGLPPTWTCMTCHSQIWTTAPMLAPVRDSLANDEPLRWKRVNRLPDYVYFNHGIHIAKGVGCSSCHGEVDRMQLTFRAKAFTMSFCITCHRAPERFVRPASEVFDMRWQPGVEQLKQGAALVRANHIRSAAELTDCSICHR